MKEGIKGPMTLATRIEAGQSSLGAMHANLRGPVNLVEEALMRALSGKSL